MIGLTGAHRVGKTTLAKQFSASMGIPYVDMSFSNAILDKMGLTSLEQINSLDQRLDYQLRRMELTEKALTGWKEPIITDRTPLDVAAYTMADFGQLMSAKQMELAEELVSEAHRITNARFRVMLLVYPGIPYIAEPGKPTPNLAYQAHIHTLILGLLADTRNRVSYFYLDRDTTDPAVRAQSLQNVYVELVKGAMALKDISSIH